MANKPTADYVRSVLLYDRASGLLTWIDCPENKARVGKVAGWKERKGYIRICLKGKSYQAHRVVWLYMMGKWPTDQIDHRNMKKDDNSWANLRLATNGQNQANTTKRRNNTSGVKGVYWHKRLKKWQASIMIEGRLISLGYRNTKKAAANLYASAAKNHFGEFARTA